MTRTFSDGHPKVLPACNFLSQYYFYNIFLQKSCRFSLQTLTKFEAAKTGSGVGFLRLTAVWGYLCSFPEPTCLLVSTKTRSSGIINKLVPRAFVAFATVVLSKPNFDFPSLSRAYLMPLWNVSTPGYRGGGGGGGGYSQKKWVGVCGPLPKTLTLFMSRLQANLRPKSAIFPTLFMSY